MEAENSDLIKVIFPDEDGGSESLWAEKVSPTLARLDNSPIFIYGVSADDLVTVERDPINEGIYHFMAVYEKSGNRTIRIYSREISITDDAFRPLLERIVAAGGSYEGFPPRLLSVTVPSAVDLDEVTNLIDDAGYEWEHGDLGHA